MTGQYRQVFVLCTGRCASHTFYEACRSIGNYSAGHETRCSILGAARLNYPNAHIEVDNRLSWILGRLDEKFGAAPFYVHLTRNSLDTARSLDRRWRRGMMMPAYADGVLMSPGRRGYDVCLDYCDTVNANIRLFLKDKPHHMSFALESAERDFCEFWNRIGATGDRERALQQWQTKYDAATDTPPAS